MSLVFVLRSTRNHHSNIGVKIIDILEVGISPLTRKVTNKLIVRKGISDLQCDDKFEFLNLIFLPNKGEIKLGTKSLVGRSPTLI